MSRKRNHRMKPRARDDVASFRQLSDHQVISEAKGNELMTSTRAALVLLLDGKADEVHIQRLGTDLNVAWIRTEESAGDRALVFEVLSAAGDAINEAIRRHAQHGVYGLAGPEREAIVAGVDAYEVILRASTAIQMERAQRQLVRLHQERAQPA